MGAIEKFVTASNNLTIQQEQAKRDSMNMAFSMIKGYLGATFTAAASGETFVGLNASKVEPIREAIRNYVERIYTELDKLNTQANNENALRGEVGVAASKYVESVSEVAKMYVSSLLAYSDAMYNYASQYLDSRDQLAENVVSEANSLKDGLSSYQEQNGTFSRS